MQETVKGLQEAIDFFVYKPKVIQTDNGFEFSDRARVRGKGFFGTIKNEMFYNEGQANMTVKEFIPYLEKYLVWFREKRIKESLGYKSMIDRRKEDGVSWGKRSRKSPHALLVKYRLPLSNIKIPSDCWEASRGKGYRQTTRPEPPPNRL